jgi:hypothetical protein
MGTNLPMTSPVRGAIRCGLPKIFIIRSRLHA